MRGPSGNQNFEHRRGDEGTFKIYIDFCIVDAVTTVASKFSIFPRPLSSKEFSHFDYRTEDNR